jgi:hypothetical protein
VLVLSWIWQVLRQQNVISSGEQDFFTPFGGEEDLSWKSRLDLFTNTIFELGIAALVLGLALGIRAYAASATLHAGGTLTGWELGEPIAEPFDLDDA